jgi:ATP-dependent Clp protease adaptor protein ClpS
VIETLIKICGHSAEQAEQCALFIHTQGKYAVKKGDYDTLKPMCDAITERGIGATLEILAG